MKIIVINGVASSGKDLFVELFTKNYKYRTINISTIDKVKEIAKNNFGWNEKKNDKSRKFLSELKKLWIEYNNGPFLDVVNTINEYNFKVKGEEDIFFVHVREPEEIQKFVDKYQDKCTTLMVKRNVDIPNNNSDQNVEKFNYDYIIENDGTIEELELKVIDFIEKVS